MYLYISKALRLQQVKMMRFMIKYLLPKQRIHYLTMDGVSASFVIAKRNDGSVGISARSLGDINVQVIMEKLKAAVI